MNPDPVDFYDLATGNSCADATFVGIQGGHSETVYAEAIVHGSAFGNLVIANTPSEVGLQSGTSAAAPEDSETVVAGKTNSVPTPCSDQARASFALAKGGRTTLSIWDVRGLRVYRIDLGYRPACSSEFPWNAAAVPSGIYFYRIESEGSPAVAGRSTGQR